jgi:hypothetical protein
MLERNLIDLDILGRWRRLSISAPSDGGEGVMAAVANVSSKNTQGKNREEAKVKHS